MNTKTNESDDVPLSRTSEFHHQDWTQIVDNLQANYPDGLDSDDIAQRIKNMVTMRLLLNQYRSGLFFYASLTM